jgi:acetyltransferase-like isoleucine patch superfamily enzyme
MTEWNWLVLHPENLTMGERVDIGAFTMINAMYGVTLGSHVQIGPHCSIMSVSTIDGKQGEIIIEKNARVGANSVIMPGATIRENAIVGACSFVNCDIPANETWFGTPARKH